MREEIKIRNILKVTCILLLVILTSCSTTKEENSSIIVYFDNGEFIYEVETEDKSVLSSVLWKQNIHFDNVVIYLNNNEISEEDLDFITLDNEDIIRYERKLEYPNVSDVNVKINNIVEVDSTEKKVQNDKNDAWNSNADYFESDLASDRSNNTSEEETSLDGEELSNETSNELEKCKITINNVEYDCNNE